MSETPVRPGPVRATASEILQSWREMVSRRTLGADAMAGVTVACVAIPLNLALALASGLPPSVGIVTGVIAGLVAGLFGSSRLQITGPEVALAPLSLEIVRRHGVQGLVVATFLAGLLQILLGASGVSRLIALIPTSIIGGFMAAIGLLVLGTQTPRLLGLPTDYRSIADLVRDPSILSRIAPAAIGLGVIVMAAMILLPRVSRRAPAVLIGLAAVLLITGALHLQLPVVGEVGVTAPRPTVPPFFQVDLVRLFPEVLALALLASLDSLLSAMAIDTVGSGKRHHGGHELVAQGFANMTSAVFGGMPVAGAIVRSTAAIQANARTRMTPIVQSLALLLIAVLASGMIARLPVAALAAVLLVVGYRLIDLRTLRRIARASRFEAMIFIGTAVAIVLTDFVSGVAVGLIMALVNFAHRQRSVDVDGDMIDMARGGVLVTRVTGPLFFASRAALEERLMRVEPGATVVIDLSQVPLVDFTAATSLGALARHLESNNVRMAVVASQPSVVRALKHAQVLEFAAGGRAHGALDEALRALFPEREGRLSREVAA